MDKRTVDGDLQCEEWRCPDCTELNFTCEAVDDDHVLVCRNCRHEFEEVSA